MTTRASPAILIVEDERIVAMDLQQSLTEMGYDAFAIAASGDEAMARATERRPDVVLMDIRIKGRSDGIETAAALKRQFPISVIYLTAHADEGMVDRAKVTEPHGYLVKPVKLAELRSMLEIALYKSGLERQLRESHEITRQLAQRLETVREEERRAVAVALHDGIAQDLFAMKLGLNYLDAFANKGSRIKKVCRELTHAVTQCMEETRQVANELRPVALAYSRLSAVVAEHARHFGKHANLNITVTESAEFPQLAEPMQLLLFRSAQEALTNVARHARATAVHIVLRTGSGRIMMEVSDDGVGIADDAASKPRSLGLLGLRERFTALGGGLSVRRTEPTGTSLTVYLPNPPGDLTRAA